MWTLEYYFSLWNYLKGEDVDNIYHPLKTLSDSEKTKVIQLFENTLDQNCFNTDDYNRLRNFLIDWYATIRTFSTNEAGVSDPLTLPNSHLDELFRSFGYPYSQQLSLLSNNINVNKVNFFLDLVNLYKIKGTPQSIVQVLRYYGLPQVDLIEYFLKKDSETADLIFEGTRVAHTGPEILTTPSIKPYQVATDGDPHWFYKEYDLKESINQNAIALPSKTPYFSLKIYYDIARVQAIMALLARKLDEDYSEWQSTGILPDQDAFITSYGIPTSFVELYLIVLYIFNWRNYRRNIIPEKYSYYTKSPFDSDHYDDVFDRYEEIHERPRTRDEREAQLQEYFQVFTRQFSDNFIKTPEDVANALEAINPSLKAQIDDQIDIYPFVDLFGPFLTDLQTWITSYVTTSAPNLAYLVLGEQELKRTLGAVINFFKPYHARLISVDMSFLVNDRLKDSILMDDKITDRIEQITWDYITCNSIRCCPDTDALCGDADSHYSRSTYDCGSFYDVGACCDTKPGSLKVEIRDIIKDRLTCRNTVYQEEPYEEINYVQDPITHEWSVVKTLITPPSVNFDDVTISTGYSPFVETVSYASEDVLNAITNSNGAYVLQSGGFTRFDEGACFDTQYANDLCEIYIIDHTP